MEDENGLKRLRTLLEQLRTATEEKERAMLNALHIEELISGPLNGFRRICRHLRVLHIRSDPYVTEADDFHHGCYIVVCNDPLRICLDCGLIERFNLAERFTDRCPREQRVRVGRDEKKEEVLERQSGEADHTAKFRRLTSRPKMKITSDELRSIIVLHPHYQCDGRYLKPEHLYKLWLEYGEPTALTSPPQEGPAT